MKRWIALAAALAVSTSGLAVSFGAPPATAAEAATATDTATGAATGAAAAAAPRRSDGYKTLILLHGWSKNSGVDCNDYWGKGKILPYLNRTRGWAGRVRMLTYYSGNGRNCIRIPGASNRDRSIDELGRDFAWYIYNTYSRRNVPVDVIAHSMGGLVTRVAIAGTQHRLRTASGRTFPPYLYIEDAATLSSPLEGTRAVPQVACPTLGRQTCLMKPRSPFLRYWIDRFPNPQSRMGTDWSAIASGSDGIVTSGSGLNKASTRWGHKYLYVSSNHLGHSEMADVAEQRGFRYRISYCHYNDRSCAMTEPTSRNRWRSITRGAGPLWVAANAVFYGSW